ncbi:hypothetical protein C1J01_08980 [Nonomuraea aridisoli]|uniref:Uncharacterized protein n=2 Tax=Nonomuraea aridisoli TaxID=2070368 RepID=A0A2W2EWH2_9ACTN|nr:hypothetical protein C1J01_08980 [Nonomuraea aridisoli]
MPGHLSACRACSAGLLRDLADVPSLEHHLELALTRQTRIENPDGGRLQALDEDREVGLTVRRAPLPYDERARQAISVLRSALAGWYRALSVDETRAGPLCRVCDHPSCRWAHRGRVPPDTLAGLARWLLRQRAALLGHAALVEAIDELGDAIRLARRAIDRPPATWYAGPCDVDGCQADLYVRHGDRLIRCRSCGATHSATARERWLLRQVADHLGTATEIARALAAFRPGLTPSMIRGYAHRGRIVSHGADDIGRPLYRIGDVLALLNGGGPADMPGGDA